MTRLSAVLGALAPAAALSGFVIISVDFETRLGRQLQAAVAKDTPRVADAVVVDYVRAIGRALAQHAAGPRFPYSFDVADASAINAFALPGGPVWIHRGALAAARSEAEVAGVLAHEIAHIAERHAARQISGQVVSSLGLGLLGALLGNSLGATLTERAAAAMTDGVFLKFSRDDERAADREGAALMARAGWDPRGLVGFMQVVRSAARRDPGAVETFFSTHPAPAERIAALEAVVRPLPKGSRETGRFAGVKRRLAR
jgi:predicted Zn-dependent protease